MISVRINGIWVNVYWSGDVDFGTENESLRTGALAYLFNEGFLDAEFLASLAT